MKKLHCAVSTLVSRTPVHALSAYTPRAIALNTVKTTERKQSGRRRSTVVQWITKEIACARVRSVFHR